MGLIVDSERAITCLDELEREFLRVGAEKCKCLEEPGQLSAFLRLGVRAVSLLRGMLRLLDENTLDSFDSVRRAFLETWQLQFEFRLADSATRAGKWFEGIASSWSADRNKLGDFVQNLGRDRPNYGREYGDLSELAHPTAQATVNSCAVATARQGLSSLPDQVRESVIELSEDFTGMLVREIWLVDAEHPKLIDISIAKDRLRICEALLGEFTTSKS